MVNRPATSIENNFIGGLKTEYTALNFPENACTSASNSVFSIIGEVDRRGGFNFETNYQLNNINSFGTAVNTYKWNNVGGDGSTQIVVQQSGNVLFFYLASNATISNPLSTQLLTSAVVISTYLATNAVLAFDPTIEVTYADGNGYLFVYHSQCDPFYVTYNSSNNTVTANRITVQTRDFVGVNDGMQAGPQLSIRPLNLSSEHQYNLVNQGWNPLSEAASNTTLNVSLLSAGDVVTFTYTIPPTTPFPLGPQILASTTNAAMYGVATASSLTSITITLLFVTGTGTFSNWFLTFNPDLVQQWNDKLGNWPSNSDVWWYFLDTNANTSTIVSGSPGALGGFNPLLANTYVLPSNTQAPQGSVVLNTFIQQRSTTSFVPGITDITTTARPTNGAWFQGRIFHTGVNANFQPTGDAAYTTWTENIYFSQIITSPTQFGYCYQQNDPTSQQNFDLLPDDGGVIVIQGSGAIYKLFPVQNGLLVFAANGIWFITGSQGIGFAATDYTVTKISGIQSIGYHSYVNVLGWPVFWNEEGIYQVQPSNQGGGLQVNNLCLGTILTFYNDIPLQSKKFARGDYNPITFVIQWLYRSTNESGINNRYVFDSALNLNTYKAPFYPYTLNAINPYVSSIVYVSGPGGSNSPDPTFKYLTTYLTSTQFLTFSEENDFTAWLDWNAISGQNYISTFTTGAKLHGQAQRQFGVEYIYVFSNNDENAAYSLQSLWDFSSSGNSGKWSGPQVVNNNIPNFNNVYRRLRLRGHGLAVQLKFTSVTGQPFNFIGWSLLENQSGSV